MTTVFLAVGEHREDPNHLLLLGDDGIYYEQRLPDGAQIPVAPDHRTWRFDAALNQSPDVEDLLAELRAAEPPRG